MPSCGIIVQVYYIAAMMTMGMIQKIQMQKVDEGQGSLHPFFAQIPLSYATPLIVLDVHNAVATTSLARLPLF